jgi:LysM repeat protein
MNYPQLWRSSGLAVSLLLTTLAAPSASAAGHTVRSGDTFIAIAKKYHLSVGSLQKANPGVNPGVIVKGQTLTLPSTAKTAAVKSPPAIPLKKAAAGPDQPTTARTNRKIPAESAREAGQLTANKPIKRTPSPSISTYRVQSGDTLTTLARRSGVSVGELAEMNGLDTPELYQGQKLIVPGSPSPPVRTTMNPEHTVDLTPPPRQSREESPSRRSAPPVNPPATQGTYYHVVKNGDTFSSIARQCRVSVAALTKANRSVNPNRLSVNQRLNVPGVQVASRGATDEALDAVPQTRSTTYPSSLTDESTSEDSPAPAESPAPADSPAPAESPAPADSPAQAGSARIAYRVTGRDTMESIAQEFTTTTKELRRMNQMGPFDQLTAGNFVAVPWQETL